MNSKKEVRKYYLDARKKINIETVAESILPLFSKWLKSTSYTMIGSYRSIKEMNELDVSLFEKELLLNVPSTRIAYPTIEEDEMNFYTTSPSSFIKKNKWNIEEIHNGKLIEAQELDMVICPLIVCDKNGFRLGYGKGFYDKYLPKVKKDCLKIGFGFLEPIEWIPELHSFDIPLDVYFSPLTVYEFLPK